MSGKGGMTTYRVFSSRRAAERFCKRLAGAAITPYVYRVPSGFVIAQVFRYTTTITGPENVWHFNNQAANVRADSYTIPLDVCPCAWL